MGSTEIHLQYWRQGHTQAERLGAQLLALEGFESVDPQAPLGGPDGRKDILCTRRGTRFVAACYFPPTLQDYESIKAKFLHDLEGVARNGAQGFVFITNQRLTLGQRNELAGCVLSGQAEVYDVERVAFVLDGIRGLSLRTEHLRIAMSTEEAIAFTAHLQSEMAGFRDEVRGELRELRRIMTHFDPQSVQVPRGQASMRELSFAVRSVLAVHRALEFEGDSRKLAGKLRTADVWLGPAGATAETATLRPPSPERLASMLTKLVESFEEQRQLLLAATLPEKLLATARFHHEFLALHPFLDGNGRVARALLAEHLAELCSLEFESSKLGGEPYYSALALADESGDLSALVAAISQATVAIG